MIIALITAKPLPARLKVQQVGSPRIIKVLIAIFAFGPAMAQAQQAPQADHASKRNLRSVPANDDDVDELVKATKASATGEISAETEELRNSVLAALGNPDPKAKAQLEPTYVKMLDDKDPDVQAAAAAGCGKLKATQAIPKIRAMLTHKTRHHFTRIDLGGASPADIRQVQALARALADLGDDQSMDEILSRDEVMGVSGFGGPLVAAFGAKILPKTVDVARKNDSRKGGALHAISFLKDPAALPYLQKLSHDSDPQIASAALRAIKTLSKSAPEFASEAESAYKDQLKNPDYRVRANGYVGLLSLNSAKYRSLIEDAIDHDAAVRTDILNALSGEKIPEIVPFLKKFIREDERRDPRWTADRLLAARAIYRMTGEKVPYIGLEKDRQMGPGPYEP